jgi:predicted NBD/HSP70 family sugar kinase
MRAGGRRFTRPTAAPQNRAMPGNRSAPKRGAPRRILVIDVGGTHIKFRVDGRGRIFKFASGPRLGPERMTRKVLKRARGLVYDAVSIGYPGLVFHGRIAAEPHNLGQGWMGFDFAKALGKPVRIVNDAAMQAIGSYRGGRMLFLGLGTGLGATLIIDGVVEPTEIGHMPYRRGRSFEDYLGERGRRRLGTRRWRAAVGEVVAHLRTALEVDSVVLGGGNAARLKRLPPGARRGDNRNAFIGGTRLWRQPGSLRLPGASAGRG